jgi:hypothetical protein
MWGDRYGVPVVVYPDAGVQAGGVLHSFGSPAEPLLFTLPQFSGGPQATWMGSERWAWWWVSPEKLISMSTSDGGDATIFAPTNPSQGPVLALGQGTSAGSLFLFQEHILPEGGGYKAIIAASDGKQAPIDYLIPPEDSSYGAVAFADTHVAWMRGISPEGSNVFERVEIWASPYSTDPSELKPEKIGDWPATHMSASLHTGGHGKYAVAYIAGQHPYDIQELVWDLNTKTKTTFQLPPDVVAKWPMGITQKYVWTVGGPAMSGAGDASWLMRFNVE